MKELQPQIDSIFRSEPHFRHRGFGMIQQADDTKTPCFRYWGLIAKRSCGSRKSGEMARIA
jgi:hypothetical protein